MEVALLVIILIFLLVQSSNMKSRFDRFEEKFKDLDRKLDIQKTTEKISQKPIIEVVEKEVKPFIPIIEEIKPSVIEKVEPIITAAETTANPVLETKKTYIPIGQNPYIPKSDKPYVSLEPKKSFWENFKEKNPDLEKFIGENLISKLGILILVLGISYFVKYSIDRGWVPVEARVAIGVLCGALVLVIGHKLRQKYAAFSSVFVAGAIAIFYFTIAIAFHDYHLISQTTAFLIMVVITAFAALISYSYDRQELAILTLIGGFAVPFMVSTGEGNYVVLFSYILILNIGILALAYYKKWNLVNTMSFVFTLLLYGGWLYKEMYVAKPHYLGALLFGFAFYTVFIIMNIINNIRTKGVFSNTQLSLLTANTFLFYIAGMSILTNFHPDFKGLFTTFLGFLNLVYAWFLYKKFGLDKKAVYLLIGLTLTFVTLAIPIQFRGHYITLFWAAEAVVLMWLAQKSKITSYRFASVIVHFLMIISLVLDWQKIYSGTSILNIIVNPIFITGLFSITSLVMVYFLLRKETENYHFLNFDFNSQSYGKYALIMGILLSYIVGILEVGYQSTDYIKNYNSAVSFVVVFHLLFCGVLSFFLYKTKTNFGFKFISLIAITNIILFTFLFIHFAFLEHLDCITTSGTSRLGFYMHYVSLAITLYFGFLLYKMRNEISVSGIFNKKIFTWLAAFFVIYIASTEIMLHGLVLMNSPVTILDFKTYNPPVDFKNDIYMRGNLASQYITDAREKITKTSFPILWGILAFVFLIVGIKKQFKSLRIIALSLLGLTIVKLFLYDISNVSETGKIIAFILLGVLILIISFVYQKIKVLVIDDKKIEGTNENEKPNETI